MASSSAFVAPLHTTAAAVRGQHSFTPCHSVRVRASSQTRRRRRRCSQSGSAVCCAHGQQKSPEPVEDGVTLPKVESSALSEQADWLAKQLTSWLNAEWRQTEPQAIHEQIGKRASQIYLRQRMEGEDDLTSVMLAIGSELEGMDFSSAFVGPWNVANTAAELLLEHCAGDRLKMARAVRGPGAVTWASHAARAEEEGKAAELDKVGEHMAAAPSLMDRFEKMKFLQDVLNGNASKQMVDGAVAVAVGFRFDKERGAWNGDAVSEEHFLQFGDTPPDILGDEHEAQMSATLLHLEDKLGLNDADSDDFAQSLHMIVETLHGVEMTRIQSEDESDHSFRKRVIVAKWLHVHGGF